MKDWNAVYARLDGLSRIRPLTDGEVSELCKAIERLDYSKTGRPKPQVKWSEQDIATLCDMIADGYSFAQAGKALGRTKNSCLSRFRYTAAEMGWQAV